MTLFTPPQLSTWLQYSVEQHNAQLVEQVVAGWLLEATGLPALPDPVPPQVFAWALELGGIAYENPTSMSTDTTADITSSWGDRRSQIFAAARRWAQSVNPADVATPPVPAPRGSFPPVRHWPDPAGPRWLG